MAGRSSSPIRKLLSPGRIMIPIVIGLGVATWLLIRSFDPKVYENINWTWWTTFWIFMALVMMVVRDAAYMYRIRVLTDKQLTWRKSFDVVMLWEFASSITPSVVGGAPIAIFILSKEKLSVGKSTAVVMVTAMLDELFYILIVPIVFVIVGTAALFPVDMEQQLFGMTLDTQGIFWAGYVFYVLLTLIIVLAVFYRPRSFKYILLQVFRLPLLRKWRTGAAKTGDEIITTSKELKGKPKRFWFRAGAATFFSWTARYWVVNCLIMAFVVVDEHFLIYARQLVMWIIMLISPTPGSSGIAEFAFSSFLAEFTQGLEDPLALTWRLVSYYPYLFIGAILLPRWLRRVYLGRKLISFKKT